MRQNLRVIWDKKMRLNWKVGIPYFLIAAFLAWFFFINRPQTIDRNVAIRKQKLKTLAQTIHEHCKNITKNAPIHQKAACGQVAYISVWKPIELFEKIGNVSEDVWIYKDKQWERNNSNNVNSAANTS